MLRPQHHDNFRPTDEMSCASRGKHLYPAFVPMHLCAVIFAFDINVSLFLQES